MASRGGDRSVAAMTTTARTHLPRALGALATLYLAGIALAVAAGLATVGEAIANGSKLNAPLPLLTVQLLSGVVAVRARGRRTARVAAGVLLAACTLSLAAAAFDGDVAAPGLSSGQVAYQAVITAVTAITWLLAARVWSRG